LQSSHEGPLLKEWLEALKVQSVDTGTSSLEGKPVSKQENPPKRRKKNKLDGFIVDSDDEADELNCISEGDDEDADSSSETLPPRKTVIRNGSKDSKDNLRLKNAVLISGPHGCGKTAAVYAVAQELDYEIFEINSSSRRSGKDLMEKVGDMTRNHLVQRHRAEKTASADDDEDTASDIKSGKQGMMTSFFKPKPGTAEKASKPSKASTKPQDALKPAAPKAQKQSLILVEEVDVLYKEDTQFWATLMSMIAQSKRPFILTCNDESLVPIQSLALHGIFRFTPPPIDLAVDLCLLVAANEGHALQRDAVEAAYVSRGEDLRATLLDLNYWCQLGVGDRRGGFDWFMLRWPRGCDVDDRGDTVRVVSENTYTKGMGWMGRDAILSSCQSLDRDEEVLQQLWNMWQLPAGHWQKTLDLQPWARDVSASPRDRRSKLDLLEAYDSFCDAMSVSDLCSDGLYGSAHQQRIDATMPDLPNKMRDDYVLGRQLLEAEPICAQTCPSSRISQCLASLARGRLLQRTEDACISSAASVLNPLTESSAMSTLTTAFQSESTQLTRHDLSLAFDPLAISDRALINSLDPSVFDRTMRLIVLDVAPYVRGIMAYDNRLMQERTKLSSLLSEGGNGKGRKRMRTTRAALSALEGGERRSTRGEKWFKGAGTGLVMRTGGAGWSEAAAAELEAQSQLLGSSMQGDAVDMNMGEGQIIQHNANEPVGIEHIA
jgi:DNA polymerase III delta prime subunit